MNATPESVKAALDANYSVTPAQVKYFSENGFIKIKNIFDASVIDYMNIVISKEVDRLNNQQIPLEERDTYGKAFLQIMNLWTHTEPKVMKPSARRAIIGRSTSLLFYAHQPASLAALENLSRAVSDRVPGMRMQVKVVAIPSAESVSPGASALFERRFMHRLDSLGFAKAQSATPWDVLLFDAFARPEVPPRLH